MRLRFGVAMPEEGGRPAIVAAEVLLRRGADARRRWHYNVGLVERVVSPTIQGADERVRELVLPVRDLRPCVFVDAGTPQGMALRRVLRRDWPDRELHRPHAYERTRFDATLFATFLEAYADGRVRFLDGLDHRRELDRALVLYRAGGVSKAGDELESEDEALVVALGLALSFPTHGDAADSLDPPPDEV